jgi:hypothetical protein
VNSLSLTIYARALLGRLDRTPSFDMALATMLRFYAPLRTAKR